jgi:CheY-like chemotaxis protein
MGEYRFDQLRILVVDDSAHMRKLVSAILQAFGVTEISEAPSGEKAWGMLRETRPDIIVLDWVMDGMSGIDLVRRIRTDTTSANPFVPVIMLTGYTQADRVERARDAGINEFLAKPVSPRALMQRLMSVIDQPRPFVRTGSYFGPCRRRRGTEIYTGPERRNGSGGVASAAEQAGTQ